MCGERRVGEGPELSYICIWWSVCFNAKVGFWYRELFVIEVKNWSGIIELKADGVWSQVRRNGTIQNHPDVVIFLHSYSKAFKNTILMLFFQRHNNKSDSNGGNKAIKVVVSVRIWIWWLRVTYRFCLFLGTEQVEATKHRANLLKFYIEKRGVTLPPSFVQPKVFLVNPDCRYIVFSTTYLPLFFQQDFLLDFVPLVLVLMCGGFGKNQAWAGNTHAARSALSWPMWAFLGAELGDEQWIRLDEELAHCKKIRVCSLR